MKKDDLLIVYDAPEFIMASVKTDSFDKAAKAVKRYFRAKYNFKTFNFFCAVRSWQQGWIEIVFRKTKQS